MEKMFFNCYMKFCLHLYFSSMAIHRVFGQIVPHFNLSSGCYSFLPSYCLQLFSIQKGNSSLVLVHYPQNFSIIVLVSPHLHLHIHHTSASPHRLTVTALTSLLLRRRPVCSALSYLTSFIYHHPPCPHLK